MRPLVGHRLDVGDGVGAQLIAPQDSRVVVLEVLVLGAVDEASASENQVYVIAADEFSKSAKSFATHGHSMIVDPWGRFSPRSPRA